MKIFAIPAFLSVMFHRKDNGPNNAVFLRVRRKKFYDRALNSNEGRDGGENVSWIFFQIIILTMTRIKEPLI